MLCILQATNGHQSATRHAGGVISNRLGVFLAVKVGSRRSPSRNRHSSFVIATVGVVNIGALREHLSTAPTRNVGIQSMAVIGGLSGVKPHAERQSNTEGMIAREDPLIGCCKTLLPRNVPKLEPPPCLEVRASLQCLHRRTTAPHASFQFRPFSALPLSGFTEDSGHGSHSLLG